MDTKMIKETIEIKEIPITTIICDVCKYEPKGNILYYRCSICKKDLCSKCVIFDPRDIDDYSCKYCKSCWNVGEPFREAEEDEENDHEEKMRQIRSDWISVALEKLNRGKDED